MTNSLHLSIISPYNLAMRIGIDSRLPYYQGGGISKYIRLLIKSLATLDKHEEYTIFHSRKETESYVPKSSNNFRRANLVTPCHHRFERWTLGIELLPHLLNVLHSPDFIPPKFGADRHIITVHDLNFIYYPDFLAPESRRYYNNQIKWSLEKADHIIVDSYHTRDDLISNLAVDPEKITAIHLAADPIFSASTSSDQIEATLKRYELPRGFLLFVGTLSPRKNVKTLLKSYAQLTNESALDLPLILIGSKGWLYKETFNLIEELGIQKLVRFIDTATDLELVHFYSSASMLALPSYYEGFGFPVLEAMQCGCPVLASDRSSLPEIAGDSALLIEPDDVEGWSQAILSILSDSKLRKDLIKAGYERSKQFSWERTAEQTLDVYLARQDDIVGK